MDDTAVDFAAKLEQAGGTRFFRARPDVLASCFEELPESVTPALVAGAIFGGAWWIWFDAVFVQSVNAWSPSITATHWFPGFLASGAAFLLTLAPARAFSGQTFGSPNELGSAECVRFYVFCCFVLALAAILTGTWHMVNTFYPVDSTVLHSWPGIALLLQTLGISFSGFVILYGRLPDDD